MKCDALFFDVGGVRWCEMNVNNRVGRVTACTGVRSSYGPSIFRSGSPTLVKRERDSR